MAMSLCRPGLTVGEAVQNWTLCGNGDARTLKQCSQVGAYPPEGSGSNYCKKKGQNQNGSPGPNRRELCLFVCFFTSEQ